MDRLFINLLFIGFVVSVTTTNNSTEITTASQVTEVTTTAITPNIANNSIEITTASQVTKVTTTAVTPNIASPVTYNYTDSNGTTCLLVTMQVQFNKSGSVVNVTNKAQLVQSESNCGKLVVEFGTGNFTLIFKNDSKLYWLYEIDAYIDGYNSQVSKKNLTLGKSSLKASYKCNIGFSVNLTNSISIIATDVQFQAFQFKNPGQYGTAQICSGDVGNNVIIPIAVGCALAGLIIIVLIAYLIGRKQVKHRYESM